jgi:hypothetical protein
LAAVWLKVRIDVIPTEPQGEISGPVATAAAREAVSNALERAEEDGSEHEHTDAFSLSVDYVEVADFDPTV